MTLFKILKSIKIVVSNSRQMEKKGNLFISRYICDNSPYRCFIKSRILAKFLYDQCIRVIPPETAPTPKLCLFVDVQY